MERLLKRVEALRSSPIRKIVDKRLGEFKALGKKGGKELYKELCFCTMAANFDAEKSIRIQQEIGDCFLTLGCAQLEKKLRSLGYRYPNRAAYIEESRKCASSLKETLSSFETEEEKREWLVKNVKGLGFKEASHFLRNIGFEDLAIIDFHILDLLEKEGLVEKPKAMTKRRYLEIEGVLRKMAGKLGVSLAELDLYLWYLETGKVLK